jgi:hypothetical protein
LACRFSFEEDIASRGLDGLTQEAIKMSTFESLSHSKGSANYHVVFIPKGRKKSLYGKIKEVFRPSVS